MVDPFSLEAIQVIAILADYHIMDGECLFFLQHQLPGILEFFVDGGGFLFILFLLICFLIVPLYLLHTY